MTRRGAYLDPAQASLFDDAPVEPPSAVVPETSMPRAIEPQPAADADPMPNIEAVPNVEAVPSLQSLLAPAVFRHPQADREIRIGEHVVGYALRRARRRSIGFIVGPEGLSVNAPKWVGVRDVETALREKGAWILRKLREQRERAARLHAAKVDWCDGTAIPFLGETVIVVLDPRAGAAQGGAVLNTDAVALPGVPKLTLHVGLAQTATPAQIRDAVQSWLQRQARRIFEERCRHFAERIGVRYTRLALSSAQTRWGSANANGAIHLNWRLIHFALPTIDYVVAHELAHLREMNHSPRFWDVVRAVLPDYERARGSLKDGVVPVFE
jgi:predicted metal-dependent hydrolase